MGEHRAPKERQPTASVMEELLRTAESFIGVREVPGPKHNPEVVGWIRRFARNLKSKWALSRDETPWCAVFVSMVLEKCGYVPTYNALAASYITWGKPSRPVPGAIVVLRHKSAGPDKATGSRTGYHVTFLKRLTKHYIVCVGGNQRNSVRCSYYPRSKYTIVAMRQPAELC